LFLSSGVIQSVDYTMEQLIEVGRLLRDVHRYNGYLHLKAVPGAAEELLMRAGRYGDRLSANIELPTQADLTQLAPEKKMPVIERTMSQLEARIRQAKVEQRESARAPSFAPAGQSTQMIVGATPSSDATILTAASHLYRAHRLRRIYYSAFSPIPHGDSRLPGQAAPVVREHRLYQADWMMRFYEFRADEITPARDSDLDLSIDPKLAWALVHREWFPVDLNKAGRHQLLRVPGLGVRNVGRILSIRRFRSIRLCDLEKLRVSIRKVRPWVIAADHNPDALRIDRDDLKKRIVGPNAQLNLFETAASAVTGEL
jgi:putative DNA modification/repair radical SAM protein